jgi:hypothetical protein
MSGKVVEFPRKLEWKHVDCWYGHVQGTQLHAKVEENLEGTSYNWAIWNGQILLAAGSDPNKEVAMDAARTALEKGVVVIRPIPPAG